MSTTTPLHCPGFEMNKNLKSFVCSCPNCDEKIEIFSDEFDKPHKCTKCGEPIDFTSCKFEGGAGA